jgi:hypothetical protein
MPRMEALESEVTRVPSKKKRLELNENLSPVRQFLLDGQSVEPFQP